LAVVRESLGEQDITTPPEYIFLPPPGRQTLIAGFEVRPHVQAFADAVRAATRVKSIGTYIGHSPSVDLALDLFHPIGDDELADEICWFAIKALNRGAGIDYIISRQRIFNPEILNDWRWMADRGSPTQNHLDHVHISFEPTAPKPQPEPEPEPVPEPEEAEGMKFIAVDNDRGIFLAGENVGEDGKIPARHVGSPAEVTALVDSGAIVSYDKRPALPAAVFDAYYRVVG
jgi:hypothetical protein